MDIVLNGRVFAPKKRVLTESHSGFYRAYTYTIAIYDRDGSKIGVINRHGVLCCATKIDGGWWYNFATIPIIGKWGSLADESKDVAAAKRQALGPPQHRKLPLNRTV